MNRKTPVIEVRNVSKTFRIREKNINSIRELIFNFENPFGKRRVQNALRGISFSVEQGETIGLIGNNGSGKSTLLKILMGSIKPDNGGAVITRGKVTKLDGGTGLDKELSVVENIKFICAINGTPLAKVSNLIDEIIVFSELSNHMNVAVKYLSKGMKMRLTFAIALKTETDILLLDEFFSGGGDLRFKKKYEKSFHEKILSTKTLVIASHNLSLLKKYCDRIIWLDNGKFVKIGKPNDVIKEYKKETRLLK